VTTRSTLTARRPRADDFLAIPDGLTAAARRQVGVVTRRQLRASGIALHRIENCIRAQRWRAIGRHVVVLQNAPLMASQREWVAVLLLDKPAALAGLSAAAAAGLRGFDPEQVHVVVRHGSHVGLPRWVRIHESRRFSAADIAPRSAPQRVSLDRAVTDAAAWSDRPRRACAVLCSAVQQRLTTAARLSAELQLAGSVRHVRIMREILGDISGGGHTLAEIDLAPLARRAGLRPPRRQVLRREPTGRVRYVDAEFDLPDATTLAVEIDGAVHLQPDSWWDDSDRQNEIVIGGRPVLRFPSLTLRLNKSRVIDQLTRMRLAHPA
jgi:hypothetical protein